MLNDYTIALLTAIQNGTAYIVPESVDKNGVVGTGKLHFPGEENYQIQSGRVMINAAKGIDFVRPMVTTARSAQGITYSPSSKLELTPLYGGTEGTLAKITVSLGENNKILPSPNPNDLVQINTSSGPTALSNVLGAAALAYLVPGAGAAIAAELGLTTTAGTALVSSALQAAQGKDLTDIVKSTATGAIGGAVAAPVAELTDSTALGNIAGSTAAGLMSGQDLEQALTSSLINQGINTVASAVAAPEVSVPDFNEQTAGLQDVYGGNLSVDDIIAGFDTVSPLADTTADLDTAFLQDMGQPIEVPQAPIDYLAADAAQTEANDINAMADVGNQPVATETPPNLEGGDLGMTEEEAQNQFYEEIGLNPETVVDTPAVSTSGDTPEIPEEVTNNLTKEQIAKLLKTGINLFGGLAAASKGLSALSGGSTPTMPAIGGGTMPTIQAPTPFTGTYSGLNPYSADYYQQVQQNYNRLFPTATVDVATPLQSWYQTQFVPDTTISNKLFGV